MKKAEEPAVVTESESVRVLRWRMTRFLGMGYSLRNSYELAESTCDIRRAEDLLARGCPEHYAVLILL